MNIYPVILSGGVGSRLWPMSREACPKQYLALTGDRSPLQTTLGRLQGIEDLQAPLIVASSEHRFILNDQLRAVNVASCRLYLEPCGRNTAPATAVVAHDLVRADPHALMLVLPADHDIPDQDAFRHTVMAGIAPARAGNLVMFGITVRWPEAGYGYIERGAPLAAHQGCYEVSRFIEKPELEIAQRLVASGRCYWNCGFFLFSAARFLEELRQFQPELAEACRAAANTMTGDQGSQHIDSTAFARCRTLSIDHAVMEHTRRAAVVPATFRWSDIGSWNGLWDSMHKDSSGNVAQGDTHLYDVSDSYIRSTQRLVVGIGLRDMVVVETPDAVLVANRHDTQRLRETVDQLRSHGRPESRAPSRVHRPWGFYQELDAGTRFRVKRITVNPGAKLSLQVHHHRAEHWVVVAGTARVTRGDETSLLTENQSAYIPLGTVHRLENPGKIPLEMIEVQSGAYLAEDDIVRKEDAYQRA